MLGHPTSVIMSVAIILGFAAGCNADEHYLEVQKTEIIGDELRCIVEARTSVRNQPDAIAESTNIRGYFVVEGLGNASENGATIGPLWKIDKRVASMTNETGISFLPGDRQHMTSKLSIQFLPNGELVAATHVATEGEVRTSRLVWSAESARWEAQGKRAVLPLKSWPSPNMIRSDSGRYVVQREKDEIVRVYDIVQSVVVPDSWLEDAFQDLVRRKDLTNATIFLTDDLRFLVVFPSSQYRDIKTFSLEGQSFLRANYGLIYERDAATPKVFKGMRGSLVPFQPFSIDNELLFLDLSSQDVALKRTGGDSAFSFQFKQNIDWMSQQDIQCIGKKVFHDCTASRLSVVLKPSLIGSTDKDDGRIRVLMWNYRDRTVKKHNVLVRDLFISEKSGFYPKQLISIED